jgi:hypothetical protein
MLLDTPKGQGFLFIYLFFKIWKYILLNTKVISPKFMEMNWQLCLQRSLKLARHTPNPSTCNPKWYRICFMVGCEVMTELSWVWYYQVGAFPIHLGCCGEQSVSCLTLQDSNRGVLRCTELEPWCGFGASRTCWELVNWGRVGQDDMPFTGSGWLGGMN